MTPTISAVRGWSTDAISAAGAAAQAAAAALDSCLAAVERSLNDAGSWRGATHDAAQARVTEERDHASEVRNVLNQIADEAKDAATDIAHARAYLIREVDNAIADGFTVSDTGEVTHADPDEDLNAFVRQNRIAMGIDTLAEFDTDYGRRISDLASDIAAMVNGQPDVTLPGGTRADPDDVVAGLRNLPVEQRRQYLDSMSPTDVRRLIQADPNVMGNLDGVPFDTRADANEINIRTALADEIAAGRGDGPRAQMLTDFLRQKNDPASAIDRDNAGAYLADDNKTERRFIAFDNTGNGRFIEMIGTFNKDTRNAAVVVPGTNSNMNGSLRNSNSAWNLAKQTAGPVFVYMNGELPQKMGYEGAPSAALDALEGGLRDGLPGARDGTRSGMEKSLDNSAADPVFARNMAPGLVDFGRELDAEIARNAPDAKTTFIGHSYGGSVVGSAEQLGLRADRMIYASSAGTGVFEGGWDNANPRVERFSMTAPGDLIQGIQSLPGNPHGADPDTAPGVTRMDSGYFGGDGQHPRRLVEGTAGHGDYWDDPNSDAFNNIARVIVGEQPTPYVYRVPDVPLVGALKHLPPAVMIDMLGLPDIPLRLPK